MGHDGTKLFGRLLSGLQKAFIADACVETARCHPASSRAKEADHDLCLGDDWGQQRGLQMGPRLWRKFILPVLRRMYGVVRDAGKFVMIHFAIIQEGQAYIYSGILGVFVFGILVRRAPPVAGVVGLWAGPVSFWLLKQFVPGVSFVDRASISFGIVPAAMLLVTVLKPRAAPVEFQTHARIELRSSKAAWRFGLLMATSGVIGLPLLTRAADPLLFRQRPACSRPT